MNAASRYFPVLPFVAAAMLPPQVTAGEQLAQKYNCVACHHSDARRVGPSWATIRGKYADGSMNAAQLAGNIKSGSSGKWGAIPMPPQPTLPGADAQAIATWILTGK